MIAQLVSFFLPQNSHNSAPTSSCCHANKNLAYDHRRMNVRVSKLALLSMREQKISSGVSSDAVQISKKNEIEDFPLGRFMRFLKHLKLQNLLKRIFHTKIR